MLNLLKLPCICSSTNVILSMQKSFHCSRANPPKIDKSPTYYIQQAESFQYYTSLLRLNSFDIVHYLLLCEPTKVAYP